MGFGVGFRNTAQQQQQFANHQLGMSSANLSGVESDCLIDIDAARQTFGDRVGYILPAAQRPVTTVSSTIVSLLEKEIKILRAGDMDIMAMLAS